MTITWVPMIAQLIATILHPFWCWLFAVHLEMNILGIGLAYTVSQFILVAFATVYATCLPSISEAISFPNADSFKGWGNYLKLGLPTMVMLWSEDLAFYGLTLLSGLTLALKFYL